MNIEIEIPRDQSFFDALFTDSEGRSYGNREVAPGVTVQKLPFSLGRAAAGPPDAVQGVLIVVRIVEGVGSLAAAALALSQAAGKTRSTWVKITGKRVAVDEASLLAALKDAAEDPASADD